MKLRIAIVAAVCLFVAYLFAFHRPWLNAHESEIVWFAAGVSVGRGMVLLSKALP